MEKLISYINNRRAPATLVDNTLGITKASLLGLLILSGCNSESGKKDGITTNETLEETDSLELGINTGTGKVNIEVGEGVFIDTDGTVGFDLGGGITLDTNGDIGYNVGF